MPSVDPANTTNVKKAAKRGACDNDVQHLDFLSCNVFNADRCRPSRLRHEASVSEEGLPSLGRAADLSLGEASFRMRPKR